MYLELAIKVGKRREVWLLDPIFEVMWDLDGNVKFSNFGVPVQERIPFKVSRIHHMKEITSGELREKCLKYSKELQERTYGKGVVLGIAPA